MSCKEHDISQLVPYKGDLRCPICKVTMSLEEWEREIEIQERPWYLKLSDNENWHVASFAEFPYVIAHEYRRIKDLLLEGCPYGAMFQIKDLLEVLIKFYSLIGVSVIYHKESKSIQDNHILKSLVGKCLSLGDWLEIAYCIKDSDAIIEYGSLKKILTIIYKTFETNKIVNWRNSEIGHGALKFKDDEDFIKDLTKKLQIIRNLFQNLQEDFEQTTLYFWEPMEQGSNIVKLKGATLSVKLEGQSHEINVIMDGFSISMYPFFKLDERGLYFFDTYLWNKSKTDILNYPVGHKLTKTLVEFDPFHVLYQKYVVSGSKLQEGIKTLDNKTYNEIQHRIIESISEDLDYIEPEYLMNEIKQFLFEEGRKRGILLLQMESGMGKTTLCRVLDEQSTVGGTFLPGFSTRAVYLNDKYLNTGHKLLSAVESKLKENKNKELMIVGVISNEKNEKRRIADLLNLYIKPYQNYFKTNKMLFIIDGLDEVAGNEGNSIFDYLPYSKDLNENVYIILTCRTKNEISQYTKNGLAAMEVDKTYVVMKDKTENIQLLTRYIQDKITKNDDSIQKILERSAYRFVYVKLSETLLILENNKIEKLPDYNSMFESYLNTMIKLYGEKEAKRLLDILEVLAITYEPLTFREISYLIGEENPSYKLIALFEDIKHLLKSERIAGRDTVYSFVHQTFRQSFEKINSERIKLRIIKFADQFEKIILNMDNILHNNFLKFNQINNNDEWCIRKAQYSFYNSYYNDGEVYIVTNILKYLEEYKNVRIPNNINKCIIKLLEKFNRPPIVNYLYPRYCSERIIVLLKQLILFARTHKKYKNKLIDLYYESGNLLLSLNQMMDALKDANDCLTISLEMLNLKNTKANQLTLSVAYGNRGNTLRRLNRFHEAIEDENNQISIIEKIKHKTTQDKIVLANAYLNRSNSFRRICNYIRAKEDADSCLRMLNIVNNKKLLPDKNDIAKAYMIRGNVLMNLNNLNAALNDHNKCIAIREELDEKKELHDRNNLASAYHCRANLFYKMKRYNEAYADYDKSINFLINQDQKGLLHDRNVLASIYMDRGDTLVRLKYFDKAFKDYNESIAIWELIDSVNNKKSLHKAYKKRKLLVKYFLQ